MKPFKVGMGLFAGLLLVLGIVAIGYWRSPRRPANRLDEVWAIVNARYYDRTFSGYDWPAVRQTYLSRLPWYDATGQTTDEAIDRMLALLESSHLTHLDRPPHAQSSAAHVGVFLPELGSLAGMTVSSIGVGHPGRVRRVDPGSLAYRSGLREGMAVWLDVETDESPLVLAVTTMEGHTFSVQLSQPNLSGPAVQFDGCVAHVALVTPGVLAAVERRRASNTCVDTLNLTKLGIEMSVPRASHGLQVTDVVKGGLAEQAGVEPGSSLAGLTSVNESGSSFEQFTVQLPSADLVHFRAPFSSVEENPPPVVRRSWLHDGATVIRFDAFDRTTVPFLDEALSHAGTGPIVLDLRNNTGGTLAIVLEALGAFLPPGTVVGRRVGAGQDDVQRVAGRLHAVTNPVAVLVGPVTASGGEVMAASLRAERHTKIFGLPTSGEVVVAEGYGLRDGGYLQVPVASFVEPDGTRLEGIGVQPDVRIWNTLADVREGKDPVIAEAVRALNAASRTAEQSAQPLSSR